ncbi:FecCD family ABC transporter permease [Nitriliruptor alkaliphilus]|uniref:FecCD family ABC transporter permease n=1 Tax=Nitriliruptor alkaliphilus TaxID=427918 RepID=UPI00146FC9CC|nr:iron ABC transporter permease [Nitriliruptor alkaliphilus]
MVLTPLAPSLDATAGRTVSHRVAALAGGIGLTTAGLAYLSLALGTPQLTLAGVLEAVTDPEAPRLARLSVLQIRLPRLVLGLLAGAALGTAGALLQSGMRNPLAGPELLGVSAGAAVTVAATLVLGLPVPLAAGPAVAFVGGLAVGGLVLAVAQHRPEPVRVVLIGACLAALCNAVVVGLVSLGTSSDLSLFQLYVLGSLTNRSWPAVQLAAPWIAGGLLLAVLSTRALDVLRLGDDVAAGLGLSVRGTRAGVLVVAVALTAATVAVCGQIGFVALLAPHLVRLASGRTDDRVVVPLAAVTGALILTTADLVGRQVLAPREIPVGVFTTLLGAPSLLWLLRRGARSMPS